MSRSNLVYNANGPLSSIEHSTVVITTPTVETLEVVLGVLCEFTDCCFLRKKEMKLSNVYFGSNTKMEVILFSAVAGCQTPYQRLDTIKMCHSAKIMSEIFL